MIIIYSLLWIVFAIIVMSFIEYSVHRWPMHSKQLCNKIKITRNLFISHSRIHHPRFHKEFEKQTNTEPTIDFSFVFALMATSFIWIPLACFSLLGGGIFACVVITHDVTWTIFHKEMHEPRGRWFSNLYAYKYLRNYHLVHHKHPAYNFNVLIPIWDRIFKTYRRYENAI